jgi:hypothetical protein
MFIARPLKDTYHRKVVERTSAAPSLFVPERRKMPVRVSSERMTAAAFRVLNSASVIRFRSLHLLIGQPWKDGERCNRAVEVDCPPGFTTASIQNRVITSRATDGTNP